MDAHKANGYTITVMAQVLEVTRQGYYAWRSRRALREATARKRECCDREVAQECEKSRKTYGAPRVTIALAKRGITADKKTVATSMKRQGLEAISTRGFRHPGRKGTAECVHPD